jgi:hypothetical protein
MPLFPQGLGHRRGKGHKYIALWLWPLRLTWMREATVTTRHTTNYLDMFISINSRSSCLGCVGSALVSKIWELVGVTYCMHQGLGDWHRGTKQRLRRLC